MVNIIVSPQFKKAVKHLNTQQRKKLETIIKKIIADPNAGKPLKYTRGERSIRMKPFRVLYTFRNDINTLYLLKFDHRKSAYE